MAALAAHQQGQFWAFSDRLFNDGIALTVVEDPAAVLVQWAGELGMNTERFQEDMHSEVLAARVAADRQEGLDANMDGTPTVFINGVRYVDSYDEASIRAHIDGLLQAQN